MKANKEKTVIKKEDKEKSLHRQFSGTVVATRTKTIQVLVKTVKMHPKYKKQYFSTKKYAVHDEKNEAKLEQVVKFEECRPLSKTKRWRLVGIVK